MEKIQLGVIFGSRSCEREVSIISAIQLMNYVDTDRYDVIPVYIDEHGVWYTGEKLRDIRTFQHFPGEGNGIERVMLDVTTGSRAILAMRPGKGFLHRMEQVIAARLDVVIPVLHGLNGEDGTLQGLLELAGIPYASTGVVGSAIGMDKILMKQCFRGAGLPVLPGVSMTRRRWEAEKEQAIAEMEELLPYPVFVKPANLGSSIGVSRAANRTELENAMELALSYDRRVLVEKGLDKPLELNCSVLGYDDHVEASAIEMPIVGSGEEMLSFFEKYLGSEGGSKGMASLHRVLPAPIEESLATRIRELSVKIFRLLDCKGVVRVDYMFDRESENIYITEINTIPGSMAFYLWEATGLKYTAMIDRLVEEARRAFEDKRASQYAYTSDILSSVSLGSKGSKGSKGIKR
ncbi:MAG: D-alanine--D-alanine ligase [Clostridia bacterium]|nr:D-alanine--D-alanine ligase [Clostridia bacterium]